ncbi:heme peroxidase [Ostertagia ostertagi]
MLCEPKALKEPLFHRPGKFRISFIKSEHPQRFDSPNAFPMAVSIWVLLLTISFSCPRLSVSPLGKALDCSSCNSPSLSENCAPIPVPADDPYFKPIAGERRDRRQAGSMESRRGDRNSKEGGRGGKKNSREEKPKSKASRCLRLTRALNAQKGLGVRTQINQNTHFLDLSAVYGSEECEGASVRSFVNGELRTYVHSGDVLPPQNKNDSNCLSKAPYYCFTTGDFRNSLHPGLVPLHTVYIKEHNRIAALFKRSNPSWNDEQTFQEARRVNIAQYQHQVYSEYLPLVVGNKLWNDFGLKPLQSGFSTGYSTSVNAALSAEFAAAAFRFGHGTARKDFPRVTNSNKTAGATVDMGSNIFYVDSHYAANQGGQASFIEGMMHHPAMKSDKEFSFPIRNQLFEIRGQPGSGVDLVAVNIMRGRDVGLFPYNDYRSLAGLRRASTFDDLKAEMDSSNVEALKRVYADVNDIDLYTGIILERPLAGAAIGPTGGYMIAEQFSALKKGDRFFYEHQVASTRGLRIEELEAVRRSHLAKVICMNTAGMETVGKDVFSLSSERVPCSSLPEIDIRHFTPPPVPK